MCIGAVIFSRLDSSRLPGKALLDISGVCLLGRVIERAKCIEGVERIILATSSRGIDDKICDFGKSQGVDIYRGSVDDVAGRALGVCRKFRLKKFARLCGDRPFFSPELVSQLIKIHNELDVDLVTTMFPRTYPPGLTTEIISKNALGRALARTNATEDREHVTNYFYRQPKDFTIVNVGVPDYLDLDGVHLVVDNDYDLARARWIGSHIDTNCDDMHEIIYSAKEWNKRNNLLKDAE